MAYRAQQLLEHSLLSELRAIVARALSGLDMFAGGQLSELDLLGSDFLENSPAEQACFLQVAEIYIISTPIPLIRSAHMFQWCCAGMQKNDRVQRK